MLLNLITLQDFCLLACCKTHYSTRPTGPVLTYNKGDRCLKYESFTLKNVNTQCHSLSFVHLFIN